MNKRNVILTLVALVTTALTVTGCDISGKFTEPFRDAPISAHNGASAEVLEMPDGFSNVSDKCDGHGHRVYVTYHGDRAYGAVAVIDDKTCG